ncbi:MAG: hypothetical protein WC294_07695 [Methanoregula sp.]
MLTTIISSGIGIILVLVGPVTIQRLLGELKGEKETIQFFLFKNNKNTMNPPSKDDILTALALIILLFSAMMTWTISSWIILVAIIIIAIAWYFRK